MFGAGERVVQREGNVDREAADVVDHADEPVEPGQRPVVHREPGQGLDGLTTSIRAAEHHRRVDLVVP